MTAKKTDTVARFRNVTVVQTAIDTFTQTAEPTAIVPSQNIVWEIERVEVDLTDADLSVGDTTVGWQLTRDSKSAQVSMDDADAILVQGLVNSLVTSGMVVVETPQIWTPPPGVIVVEPTLYFGLFSSGTGSIQTAYFRIYYNEIKLSELEILRALSGG